MNEQSESHPRTLVKLCASDEAEAQYLIAVATIGMCRCLSQGIVSSEFACSRLFGPAVLQQLEMMSVNQKLQHAFHLATELDDVRRLVPEEFEASVAEIDRLTVAALEELEPSGWGTKWCIGPKH